MTLIESISSEGNIPPIPSTPWSETICDEVSTQTISLLWLRRLEFDLKTDISDSLLDELLNGDYYYLSNFEENWYSSICKPDPEMGTGYNLVSESYLQHRWMMQWIEFPEDAKPIWMAQYNNRPTSLYIVHDWVVLDQQWVEEAGEALKSKIFLDLLGSQNIIGLYCMLLIANQWKK